MPSSHLPPHHKAAPLPTHLPHRTPAAPSNPWRSKNPRDHMVNVWGYSHLNFFAPMSRFGSGEEFWAAMTASHTVAAPAELPR